MKTTTQLAEYVKPTFLVEFDRLSDAYRRNEDGTKNDAFAQDLQENLACVAMIYWERAEKIVDLGMYDRRIFARAAVSLNGKDAEAVITKAIEDVRRRADNYRSVCVDDLRHLRLQAERDAALPHLETAAALLGMMALGAAYYA
jgi:hypothetical protein